uniref:Uncharacterized protein n=1 Tax=Arundo donax TaxID=35708 RepID=A0A0A9CKE3_ARUDO
MILQIRRGQNAEKIGTLMFCQNSL